MYDVNIFSFKRELSIPNHRRPIVGMCVTEPVPAQERIVRLKLKAADDRRGEFVSGKHFQGGVTERGRTRRWIGFLLLISPTNCRKKRKSEGNKKNGNLVRMHGSLAPFRTYLRLNIELLHLTSRKNIFMDRSNSKEFCPQTAKRAWN